MKRVVDACSPNPTNSKRQCQGKLAAMGISANCIEGTQLRKSCIHQWARQCELPVDPHFAWCLNMSIFVEWITHAVAHSLSQGSVALSCPFWLPTRLVHPWHLSFVLWDTEKSLVFLNIPPDCVMWAFSYHMCPEESHMEHSQSIILKSRVGEWSMHSQGSKDSVFQQAPPSFLHPPSCREWGRPALLPLHTCVIKSALAMVDYFCFLDIEDWVILGDPFLLYNL